MSDTTAVTPTSIRRLDTASGRQLSRLIAAYDDLQTVLRCCDRLMAMLKDGGDDPDDIGIEALWTLALLSYARSFAEHDGKAALGEADLDDSAGNGEALRWHRVLLHLRDRHADPVANPRETYTVGVAQDAEGAVNAVAVTSMRAPAVDEAAVRQAGAMALPLCTVLDERIDPLQKAILAECRGTPIAQLDAMDVIEVAPVG